MIGARAAQGNLRKPAVWDDTPDLSPRRDDTIYTARRERIPGDGSVPIDLSDLPDVDTPDPSLHDGNRRPRQYSNDDPRGCWIVPHRVSIDPSELPDHNEIQLPERCRPRTERREAQNDPYADFDCRNRRYIYRFQPAVASEYIGHASKEIAPGNSVVIVARTSHSTQTEPTRQLAEVYRAVKELGAIVPAAHARIESGWDEDWLRPAIKLAKRFDAALVAMSADRFIRSRNYSGNRELPSKFDFANLETDGVRLLAISDPDAPESEVRSEQTRRGLDGRIKKKERRLLLQRLIVELKTYGHSNRDLEEMLGGLVSYRTIGDWVGDSDRH